MTTQNAKRVTLESLKESRKGSQNFDLQLFGAEDEFDKNLDSKGFKDATSKEASRTEFHEEKGRKGMTTTCKWNRKEIELSVEIRDNDKTQTLIEKTKRAVRKNEQECAKLKRRVNDGIFL